MNCRIRLIARAARFDGSLDIAVEPVLLPAWHLLASVEEEYNAVYLRCAASGDLSFFGKGAGALPRAAAVLGDLIELAQDNSVRWPVPQALAVARPGSPARRPISSRATDSIASFASRWASRRPPISSPSSTGRSTMPSV